MRSINTEIIAKTVEELFIEANYSLPQSVKTSIEKAKANEESPLASDILDKLLLNCDASKDMNVPICQDTGMAVVFLEIGQEVALSGESLENAVNRGVRAAYDKGYMRKSVVCDPLFDRTNTNDNTPAIIHTKIVDGENVKITAAPKGFGSENMSALKMFTPSATPDDIVEFVKNTVISAGSNPCPPVVVGVGLGGDFESCALLSKIALCRDVDERNSNENYAHLEKRILDEINGSGIGPQGFGGNTTALAVNIEYYPTHIAGLPCAVNIGCHVTRHKSAVI